MTKIIQYVIAREYFLSYDTRVVVSNSILNTEYLETCEVRMDKRWCLTCLLLERSWVHSNKIHF